MNAQHLPRQAEFVGRDHALSTLRAALDGARSLHGALIMLVGEAGLGKTRTAEQLAALATEQGFRVLWGRCHEEGAPPYWPWTQALRAFAEEDSTAALPAGDEAAAAVSDLLVRLDGSMPASEHGSGTHPESARFRLCDAVNTFLQRAARHQPILLVLDDLHEADSSSLHLLAFVGRGLARARILVVATCRPPDSAQRQSPFAVLSDVPLRTMPLGGLDSGAVEQLMTDALGRPPSRALLRSVLDLTEGNPFFVMEIARWLIRESGVRGNHVDGIPIPVPHSVKAVITRHLDQLSAPTRELLRIAAIPGRHVNHGLLVKLWAEESEGQLFEMLDEALRLQILHEGAREGQYRFHHALIRQVLYEELALAVRTRLHARIAGVLETEYNVGAEHHVHELAYHFGRAQPLLGAEKVVRYSRVAGERDLAAHAYDEAALHFERAIACKTGLQVDAETAALLYGLGCARAATSLRWNRQEAWEYLRRAAEFFLRSGAVERAVDAVTHAAITPEAVIGVAAMIERVRAAVSPDSREAGWLLSRQAAAHYFETGDYAAASRAFGEASSLARQIGDDALELRTLALQTSVDHFDMRWAGVLEKSQRVISLARMIDDPHAETYARYRFAYALAYTGRASEARPQARLNLAGAERLGDQGLHEDALYVNAALAQLSGDWSDAREFGDRGLDIAPHHLGLLHLRVLLESELGDTEKARAYLARLLQASAHAGPYPLREAFRAVVFPQIALLTVEPIPFDSIPTDSSLNPNAIAMRTVARALTAVQEGDAPEAKSALRLLAPKNGSILAPLLVTDRLLGLLEHVAARLDQAASHYEDALGFCRGAGYKPELAWTCYDYARSLLARDQAGDRATSATLLQEAQEISAHLGMLPLHGRIIAFRERHQAKLERRPDALTRREVKVIRLISLAKTNQEIASDLFISTHTVAAHVAHILAKTGCKNRTEAATYAMRELPAES